MRKAIIIITACVLIMAGATTAYGAEYTDVTSRHWAYEAVNAMSEKGILNGYHDGSFLPNNRVTYGEFIKMALIAGTREDVGNAPSEHWAANYYNRAMELKYFTGYDINKAQLGNQITRGDMALIISAILGDTTINNYDEIQQDIEDVTYQTKHEYEIIKSYAAGILTGYTDHTFRPEDTLSRAESAAVIHRLVDESKRQLPGAIGEETTQGAITYPTSQLLDMSKLTPDRTIAVSVHFTDEYELYTDASVWDMKMFREFNGESCAFDHTLRGHIYLVKDGEIVEYCNIVPQYDSAGNYLYYHRSRAEYDISKVDYIICVPSNAKSDENVIIKAIVNPFRQ